MRIAIGVEYNGAGFRGWQRQNDGPTVQGVLEDALSHVANHPVVLHTAGRTDTGVHATYQVAHFDTHSDRSDYAWWRGGNTHLPPQVTITWAKRVDDDFHARYSACSRSYRYVLINRRTRPAIWNGLVGWEYRSLQLAPIQEAAALLLGEHDFSAFRAAGCQAHSPIRTLSHSEVCASGEWVWYDVRANGFLQHMVRNIVGVLLAVGSGEQEPGWVSQLLSGRDRRQGGVTAVPDGLYLSAIEYPDQYALPRPQPAVRFW